MAKFNTEEIKRLLRKMDRTESWLAKKIGVSRETMWHRLNQGSRSTDELAIAKALNVNWKRIILPE